MTYRNAQLWHPANGYRRYGRGQGVTSAAMPYAAKSMSVYQMLYSPDESMLDVIPPSITSIRPAFYLGNGPSLAGFTTLGSKAALSAACKKLRNERGIGFYPSFGGGGNTVNMERAAVVAALRDFNDTICPIDGFDVDVEGGAMPTAATLKGIIDDMRTGGANPRGPEFGCTMVPNGSWVSTYLPIAVALQGYGPNYLLAYGQQFYDSPVTDADMKSRINEYRNAGLPWNKWEMGIMNPPGGYGDTVSAWWTNDTAVTRINSAKAAYDTATVKMRGSYYWETKRVPTAQAAALSPAKTGQSGMVAGDGMLQWASRIGGII